MIRAQIRKWLNVTCLDWGLRTKWRPLHFFLPAKIPVGSQGKFYQSMVARVLTNFFVLAREGYRPDRVFFVREKSSGEICATAAAVRGGGAEHGYLHFVGVRPRWAGHKLGYCVSCAATESFKADGCTDAALNTDAHRLAALKTYLRLGYRPQPRHEAHGGIWTKALSEIGFAHIEVYNPGKIQKTAPSVNR